MVEFHKQPRPGSVPRPMSTPAEREKRQCARSMEQVSCVRKTTELMFSKVAGIGHALAKTSTDQLLRALQSVRSESQSSTASGAHIHNDRMQQKAIQKGLPAWLTVLLNLR